MTIDLNATIPVELIDFAQEQNACGEALHWLREQPRTWKALIDYQLAWVGWAAAFVFAIRGEYEAAEQLCAASNIPAFWRGCCAKEAAKRGDYEQAEQLCAASNIPVKWRAQCAEIRQLREAIRS